MYNHSEWKKSHQHGVGIGMALALALRKFDLRALSHAFNQSILPALVSTDPNQPMTKPFAIPPYEVHDVNCVADHVLQASES